MNGGPDSSLYLGALVNVSFLQISWHGGWLGWVAMGITKGTHVRCTERSRQNQSNLQPGFWWGFGTLLEQPQGETRILTTGWTVGPENKSPTDRSLPVDSPRGDSYPMMRSGYKEISTLCLFLPGPVKSPSNGREKCISRAFVCNSRKITLTCMFVASCEAFVPIWGAQRQILNLTVFFVKHVIIPFLRNHGWKWTQISPEIDPDCMTHRTHSLGASLEFLFVKVWFIVPFHG